MNKMYRIRCTYNNRFVGDRDKINKWKWFLYDKTHAYMRDNKDEILKRITVKDGCAGGVWTTRKGVDKVFGILKFYYANCFEIVVTGDGKDKWTVVKDTDIIMKYRCTNCGNVVGFFPNNINPSYTCKKCYGEMEYIETAVRTLSVG